MRSLFLKIVFKTAHAIHIIAGDCEGARNPNLQVAIAVCGMYKYIVCSQHSFELPLRMSGMHSLVYSRARLCGNSQFGKNAA